MASSIYGQFAKICIFCHHLLTLIELQTCLRCFEGWTQLTCIVRKWLHVSALDDNQGQDRMAACQSWICFPLLQCHVFMVYVLLCWGVFFSVLRLYSKWSIVWGLKNFFSSSLSSCKKLYFLNTLSPVLSTPLSYVCCVCMDRLMANFAGTCTSDNKGLLLLLLLLLIVN